MPGKREKPERLLTIKLDAQSPNWSPPSGIKWTILGGVIYHINAVGTLATICRQPEEAASFAWAHIGGVNAAFQTGYYRLGHVTEIVNDGTTDFAVIQGPLLPQIIDDTMYVHSQGGTGYFVLLYILQEEWT